MPKPDVFRTLACPEKVTVSAATVLPAFNESAILWGLTDYIVKRGTKELNDWFYTRYRDELCSKPDSKLDPKLDPKKIHAAPLLENTCRVLLVTELPELLAGPGVLQTSIRKDIEALPNTAPHEYLRLSEANKWDLDPAFSLIFLGDTAAEVLSGTSVVLAISDRASATTEQAKVVKCALIARHLYAISYLLEAMVKDGKLTVPKPDQIKDCILALAVNAEARGQWSTGLHLDEIEFLRLLDKEKAEALSAAVQSVANSIDRLEKLKAAGAAADKTALLRAHAELVDAALSVIVTTLDLLQIDWQAQKWFSTARAFASSAASGDYPAMVIGLITALGSNGDLPPVVRRGLYFAIAVAEAGTAASASDAFAAFAAPPGSFRFKRNSEKFYFFLNAYAGANFSWEWANKKGAFALSPWLPVGVEVGHGLHGNGSLGFFVQILDVGALASYRIKSDDVSSSPEVGFRQVLSPGAYFVYGFPKIPLSIGVGGSFAPQLRSLKDPVAGQATNVDAKRVSVTVGLDLPLFP